MFVKKMPLVDSGLYPFRLPQDLSTPMILIGPGTGVAPFVGFLEHVREQLTVKRRMGCGASLLGRLGSIYHSIVQSVGEIWLITGCRQYDRDNLYGRDLEEFFHAKVLSKLIVCASREPDAGKPGHPKYVQDAMKEHAASLYRIMSTTNGRIYVCG